ncbi:MAG: hypothetical protein ACRBBP_04320 [Bdellovibrionales bacterium]
MNKVICTLSFIFCISSATTVSALNTFVGNGGSAGDMELLVTEKQLKEVLKDISLSDEVDDYCKCQPVFENHLECTPLNGLSEKQRLYCSSSLKKSALAAGELLQEKSLRFNWTREDIYVRDGGQITTVDAVANPQSQTITINQTRFLNLPATKRLFLLAHEIFHMVPIDGKSTGDSGEVGPFNGAQGARKLINSMASGVVMNASDIGSLRKYESALRRRKSYKKSWVDLSFAFSSDINENTNVYSRDSYGGVGMRYRNYFGGGKFGFNTGVEIQRVSEDFLLASTIEERNLILSAGLSYRFMPFSDPLSLLGQSFVNIDGSVEYLDSSLSVEDSHTSLSSSDNSFGWSADIKYYLPLKYFWLHVGVGLRDHEYKHGAFNLEKNSLQKTFKLGVSYAF